MSTGDRIKIAITAATSRYSLYEITPEGCDGEGRFGLDHAAAGPKLPRFCRLCDLVSNRVTFNWRATDTGQLNVGVPIEQSPGQNLSMHLIETALQIYRADD